MLNMCQISSLMAAAEGPVAEFSSLANFEEKKRKSNLLMPFPKKGDQMGSFGQIRKKSFFRFCRPILDIFGFTLLRYWYFMKMLYTEVHLREQGRVTISLVDLNLFLSLKLNDKVFRRFPFN